MVGVVDIILVPQGAEHRAVCRGLRRLLNPPAVLPIPVGAIALLPYLQQLQQSGCFAAGQQVLVMGLCGGLQPDLTVGERVLYHTCTTTYHLDSISLHCDRVLSAHIQHTMGDSLRQVAAVTSDRVISRAKEKRQLAVQSLATVVDMEGFTVLQVLTAAGLSVAMVRVVSDSCQHDLPNLAQAFDAKGALQPLPLAIAMLQQPIAALRLIRGSTQSLKILQTLTSELFKNAV